MKRDMDIKLALAVLRTRGAHGGDASAGYLPGQLPQRGEGHRRRVHIEITRKT